MEFESFIKKICNIEFTEHQKKIIEWIKKNPGKKAVFVKPRYLKVYGWENKWSIQ